MNLTLIVCIVFGLLIIDYLIWTYTDAERKIVKKNGESKNKTEDEIKD